MKDSNKYNYIKKRDLYIIFGFSIIIFIISFYRPLFFLKSDLALAAENGFILSNFDILCSFQKSGCLDFFTYLFFIIPLFTTLIVYIVNSNNGTIMIIRYKSRDRLWNKNVILILVSALITSTILVIGGYLVSGFIIKGYNNIWNTEAGMPFYFFGTSKLWKGLSKILVTYKIIPILWITTFLGLTFIGMFISFAKLIIRDIYIYMVIIATGFIDYSGIINFPIIAGISINVSNWTNPITIVFHNIYFAGGIIIMYFAGSYINSKKDQCIGKRR